VHSLIPLAVLKRTIRSIISSTILIVHSLIPLAVLKRASVRNADINALYCAQLDTACGIETTDTPA